jgi:hypothetical protein
MSELGQERRFAIVTGMSALPPNSGRRADIAACLGRAHKQTSGAWSDGMISACATSREYAKIQSHRNGAFAERAVENSSDDTP